MKTLLIVLGVPERLGGGEVESGREVGNNAERTSFPLSSAFLSALVSLGPRRCLLINTLK
jgi:hypothetical protein